MKLSVTILTWNTVNTLRETLRVLEDDLKGIESEIIIVDNGSSDGCQDLATIRNEKNLGISVGKNQGIDASQGKYILLLDGDIVPVPNSVRLLVQWLDAHPECDAIGMHPKKFSNRKNTDMHINHETWCKELVNVVESKYHCIFYGIFRRSVFERGVRLDEETYGIGYGWEDLDVWMQMEALGIKQYGADINHVNGKYYHEINSSIRQMGFEEYMRTSLIRAKKFRAKWHKQNFTVNGVRPNYP